MSWAVSFTVRCDARSVINLGATRCDQWEEVRNVDTVEQARERLTRLGWTVEDGQDRCPLHRSTPRTLAEILFGS